jgi:ribosomal protein S18 acetylase RimI-like enzyme
MNIRVSLVDYLNPQHAKDFTYLLNAYAEDPMGGGKALPDDVKQNLTEKLSKIPHAFSIICYVDDQPAGLINCFEAFSTFKCQPLVNIHDIAVMTEFRGLGISQRMLEKVEEQAKARGCCKITLEVLEGNEIARNAYLKFGFDGYELDPKMGKALFWQKAF